MEEVKISAIEDNNTLNDNTTLLEELEKNEINCVLLKEPTCLVEILESRNLSHTDRVRIYGGEKNEIYAVINIYPLHYSDGKSSNGTEFVMSRAKSVKEIYYRWCAINGLKPNHNEGWFKSKKFIRYLDSLNYNEKNYAIMIAMDE